MYSGFESVWREGAMSLANELQKLPMRARAVLLFLATQDKPATTEAIRAGTGLGERGAGKAIRQLVTGSYIHMPEQGQYVLTEMGRQAADELRAAEEARRRTVARHTRRLAIVLAQELVIGTPARVMVGLDAPLARKASLPAAGQLLLRLSAANCDVEPSERLLEAPVEGPAGPVAFRVTPHQVGGVRFKLEAHQVMTSGDMRRAGGVYFDVNVADFPTPQSAEIQALGGPIELHTGVDA
jgi:hypothetical protein